jgi:hypothetical protein
MSKVIDVSDLKESEIVVIQDLVKLLRNKSDKSIKSLKEENEEIVLKSFPSNVKCKITRKEIYDYL